MREALPSEDGWYLIIFYQHEKEKPEHPTYFKEWLECKNSKWDYQGYKEFCIVDNILKDDFGNFYPNEKIIYKNEIRK